MQDCLFCHIASGRIPSRQAYADDEIYAFLDINPQSPVHVLVIPRRHLATLNELRSSDDALMGRLVRVATELATEHGIAAGGYRLVLNCNADAGQSVGHIHLHLLGGRRLNWPPG
jgi:histidine triad (HIT) family protein